MCVLFFWVRTVLIEMVNSVECFRVITEENNFGKKPNGFYNFILGDFWESSLKGSQITLR